VSLTSIFLDQGKRKEINKVILSNPYFIIDDAEVYPLNSLKDKALDLSKVIVCIDHDIPSSTSEASEKQKRLIEFSRQNNLPINNGTGIGIQLLIENKLKSGDVVLGCGYDVFASGSKGALGIKVNPDELVQAVACNFIEIDLPEVIFVELTGKLNNDAFSKDLILTVIKDLNSMDVKGKVVEFYGDGLSNLSEEDFITLCALVGKTNALSALVNLNCTNANNSLKYDLSTISSMFALPDDYKNIVSVKSLDDKVFVNQVFLGGNSGGKISDLRAAAGILKGKKIAKGLRMIVAPSTSNVYIQMLNEGLFDTFLKAGCVIMNQGYSADYGKAHGILDAQEICVSAGDNNDKELMGGKDSKIYVVSSSTAAKTALVGYLGKETGGDVDGK
jgi:homoaconitase/3-isopropylmalate dehydratase large subunit